jgi:hypothetical protein
MQPWGLNTRRIIHSQPIGEQDDLILINYLGIYRSAPIYDSVDSMLDMTFGGLSLTCNDATIAPLIDLIDDLASAFASKR